VLGISVVAIFNISCIIKKTSTTAMYGLPSPAAHGACDELVEGAEEKQTLKQKVARVTVKSWVACTANQTEHAIHAREHHETREATQTTLTTSCHRL
jgi:hypothetical protein